MTMTSAEYADYRREKDREGRGYEAYLAERLRAEGVKIELTGPGHLQFDLGDSSLRIEFKFDQNMAKTGNLYIEVDEKSDPNNATFVPSGIYAGTRCKWYGIGDYRDWYVMPISKLQQLHKAKDYVRIVLNRTKSGHGMLITRLAAANLAVRTRHWPDRKADGSSVTITDAQLQEVGEKCFGLVYDDRGRAVNA